MTADVQERFATLPERESVEEYNFTHFLAKHGLRDARATVERRGIQPGELAPDFVLLLAPLALRATPLPPLARYALSLAFLAVPVLLLRQRKRTINP